MASFLLFSCADEDLSPIATFDKSGKGGYPRLTAESGLYDLAKFSSASYDYTVEFVTIDQGENVDAFDLYVSFVDNNPDNGNSSKAEILYQGYTQSDFTTNAKGFKEISISLPLSAVAGKLGLKEEELNGNDSFRFRSVLTLNDGSVFTFDNSSGAVNGSAFAGHFNFTNNLTCPMTDDQFTGTYQIAYSADTEEGAFGWTFGANPGTLTFTATSPTKRSASWDYLPDNYAFGVDDLSIEYVCDKLFVSKMVVGAGCGGNISLVQGDVTTFDLNDDSTITINLFDYFEDGGCGVEPLPVTIILTKQ